MSETLETKKFSVNRVLKVLAIVALLTAIILMGTFWYYFVFDGSDDLSDESEVTSDETALDSGPECNVLGIELHGQLLTYISNDSFDTDGKMLYDESASEDIVLAIESAESEPTTKAILLEIDSTGGDIVAAEEVANALKNATKPTVALIRGYGDSAAYYSATGADIIFASKSSDVGSIGVTMSYLDYSKQNEKEGMTYNSLSTGKYKDYGDPDKLLTADERRILERDLKILHENFVSDVATNRKMDINKVRQLADGSSVPGQMALDNGLIDRIGGFDEVEQYLKEKIGEDIDLCW
jgi:protease-4